jgi:mannose-6-phosphate isomerase-like protein (cupin superfamily)
MSQSVPHGRSFESRAVPEAADCSAPDGSEIRLLGATVRASSCQARLAAGETARAVRHRTVDELWYVLAGEGELWRRSGELEETLRLHPGLSLTIPCGTSFQWRSAGDGPLEVLIATVPPWPGDDEADDVAGPWAASASRG